MDSYLLFSSLYTTDVTTTSRVVGIELVVETVRRALVASIAPSGDRHAPHEWFRTVA